MLRSLYSMSRRLPAYGLFAALRRRQRAGGGAAAGAGADMGFRIHPPEAGGAADPTALQAGMTQFRFTPVETPSGFLDFSVQYLEELPPPRRGGRGGAVQVRAVVEKPSFRRAAALNDT